MCSSDEMEYKTSVVWTCEESTALSFMLSCSLWSCTRFLATFPVISATVAHAPKSSTSAVACFLLRTASSLAVAKRHCSSRQCAILIWCPASEPLPPLRDREAEETGEDMSSVAAAARDASSVACFRRLKRWPQPRLMRPFLDLAVSAGTVVVCVLSGGDERRPGESAHCVAVDPSRRTEVVRGSSRGGCLLEELELEAGVRGVEEDPMVDASLHSDPESASRARRRRSEGTTRPGVSVTPAGFVDGKNRIDRPNGPPLPIIFLPAASLSGSEESAKRGSPTMQLRCRDSAVWSSFARWSARDAARGEALFVFLLFSPEVDEGQSVREAAVESVVRDKERRAVWRPGDESSAPEADVHRFDDDDIPLRCVAQG